MKHLFYILLAGTIFTACSNEEMVETKETPKVATKVVVTPNQVMTMEIDGMVCKMGCGGSIRKGLKGTNGVATVEFDFEEERKTNVAKISYDKSLVSGEELVNVVSKLNDGQFLVGAVSFSDVKSTVNTNGKDVPTKKSSETKINVSSTTLKFPNLLDLFSSILK